VSSTFPRTCSIGCTSARGTECSPSIQRKGSCSPPTSPTFEKCSRDRLTLCQESRTLSASSPSRGLDERFWIYRAGSASFPSTLARGKRAPGILVRERPLRAGATEQMVLRSAQDLATLSSCQYGLWFTSCPAIRIGTGQARRLPGDGRLSRPQRLGPGMPQRPRWFATMLAPPPGGSPFS